jgi:hypothetical protein
MAVAIPTSHRRPEGLGDPPLGPVAAVMPVSELMPPRPVPRAAVERQQRRVGGGALAVTDGQGPDSARHDINDPVHAMQCSHGAVPVAHHAHDVANVPHQPAAAPGHVAVDDPVDPRHQAVPALGRMRPVHQRDQPALALGHVNSMHGPMNPDRRPAVALGHVNPVDSHYQSALTPDHAPGASPMYAAVTSRTRSQHMSPPNHAARTPGDLNWANGKDELVRLARRSVVANRS